ncbi:hypothetical protein [Sporosarcina sp. FSL K6-3457]|uniref:hypothetical protein n=1 Tax=Sporosarcina sp. FSL K6-3457 TaxID=2978204 RepID=UPI0030F6D436
MKKMFGVFLVCVLLLGAGTIYANGHAGQNLFDWYKGSFQKKSEKLGSVTATEITLAIKEVNTFLQESKASIDDKLAIFHGDKVKEAKSSIEAYQTQTITSLNDMIVELENISFDDYVDELNIEAEMDQDFEKIVEEVFGN